MKTWKYGGIGRVPKKLTMFVAGCCCSRSFRGGPVRAQSVNIDSLQNQIKALQEQVDALRPSSSSRPSRLNRPRLLLPQRCPPRPLRRRAAG